MQPRLTVSARRHPREHHHARFERHHHDAVDTSVASADAPGSAAVSGDAGGAATLPVIALATTYLAAIARITRSSMLEVMNSNFIRTARAKGLPMRRIILRHALKPAMLPVLSYLGPAFVAMITGSVVIDVFFSTGGIGQYFVNSALNRDYSVIMGVTILVGVLTILFNLVVDILYAWIDPKIRY